MLRACRRYGVYIMTEHVTISLTAAQLEVASREAARLGVSVEVYLKKVVDGGLTGLSGNAEAKRPISVMFGLIPASAGPPRTSLPTRTS